MNITATPSGNDMLIDCDECGPIGSVNATDTHNAITGHLVTHGIIAPPQICGCGYDWSQITGHPHDHAHCLQCDWTQDGMFADHAATHHWRDTQHPWALTMGNDGGAGS